MKPEEWIVSGEVGVSSKTLWAFFVGVPMRGDLPHDTDDWQRCHKLLTLFPEWRARLTEVGVFKGEWKPLIDRWEELELLWNTSTLPSAWASIRTLTKSERTVSEKMYRILKECQHEGIRELERRGIVKIEYMNDSGYSLKYL